MQGSPFVVPGAVAAQRAIREQRATARRNARATNVRHHQDLGPRPRLTENNLLGLSPEDRLKAFGFQGAAQVDAFRAQLKRQHHIDSLIHASIYGTRKPTAIAAELRSLNLTPEEQAYLTQASGERGNAAIQKAEIEGLGSLRPVQALGITKIPGLSFAGRAVDDLVQGFLGTPEGLVMLADSPGPTLRAIGHYYGNTYGPALHGHIGETLSEINKAPGGPILDAWALASLGAGAASKAGAIARTAGSVRHLHGSQFFGSPNELTRRLQGFLDDTSAGTSWLAKSTKVGDTTPLIGGMSRAARQLAKTKDQAYHQHLANAVPAARAVRHLKGDEKVAVDRIGRFGNKAVELVKEEVQFRLDRLARKDISVVERRAQKRQLAALERAAPLIERPTVRMQEAIPLVRALAEESQNLKIRMGLLDERTAEERLHLAARIVGRTPELDTPVKQEIVSALEEQLGPEQARYAGQFLDALAYSSGAAEGLDPAVWLEKTWAGVKEGDIPKGALAQSLLRAFDVAAAEQVSNRIIRMTEQAGAGAKSEFTRALPPGIKTTSQFVGLMRDLHEAVRLGVESIDWYERSAAGILAHVGGDVEKADRFAQLISITSPRNRVPINAQRAVAAWDEYERTGTITSASIPMKVQLEKALEVVHHGSHTFGQFGERKTMNFYGDLLRYINPEKYARLFPDESVTIDTWMHHAFGYPFRRKLNAAGKAKVEVALTDAKYHFMQDTVQALADQMGLTGDQVQAAIWTTYKHAAEQNPKGDQIISLREALRRPAPEGVGGSFYEEIPTAVETLERRGIIEAQQEDIRASEETGRILPLEEPTLPERLAAEPGEIPFVEEPPAPAIRMPVPAPALKGIPALSSKTDPEILQAMNDAIAHSPNIHELQVRNGLEAGIEEAVKAEDFETAMVLRNALEHGTDTGTMSPEGPIFYQGALGQKGEAGVKGAIQFGPDGATLHLTEKFDASTFVHELGHVMLESLADGPVKDRLFEYLKVVGGKPTRKQHERFARIVEQYFRNGEAPNRRLGEALDAISAEMKVVYPEGVPVRSNPEIRRLVAGILDSTKHLKAGEGAFFIRDIDRSLGGKVRSAGRSLTRRHQLSTGKKNKGTLFEQGRFRADPRGVIEDFAAVGKHKVQLETIETITKNVSKPLNDDLRPDEKWTYFNPDGVKLNRAIRDSELWQENVTPRELEQMLGQDYQDMLASVIPSETDVLRLREQNPAMAERVMQIPVEYANAIRGGSVIIPGGGTEVGHVIAKTFDLANDINKSAIIYLSGHYVPLNFLSNLAFLAIQQGPFFPASLIRSVGFMGGLSPETLRRMDFAVGQGAIGALGTSRKIPVLSWLAEIQGAAADVLPRRAAFIYEAWKHGFRSEDQLYRLLTDEHLTAELFQVSESAKHAMVKFDGLNEFEKKYVTRAIFIYPWVKGDTRYGFRLIADKPIRADAIVHLGQEGYDETQRLLGKVKRFFQGLVVLGTKKVGGEKIARVVNPASLTPFGTTSDVYEALAHANTPREGLEAGAFLQPQLQFLIAEAFRVNPRYGDAYPEGTSSAGIAKDILGQEVPGVGIYQAVTGSHAGKVYRPDQDWKGVLGRILLGTSYPRDFSITVANKQAAAAKDNAAKANDWVAYIRRQTGRAVPAEVIRARRAKSTYQDAQKTLKDKLNVTKLTDVQRTGLKLQILGEQQPQYRQTIAAFSQELEGAGPEVQQAIDRWAERTLGFSLVDQYSSYARKLEQARG